MRTRLLCLAALLLGCLAVVTGPVAPANASCAGPYLVDPTVLHRSDRETVRGRNFARGCADVGTCTDDGCTYDEMKPAHDVRLWLLQDGHRWLLGSADAGPHYRVRWAFRLPGAADTGAARLRAGVAPPVRITIR